MENELHIDGNESLRDCGDDDSESITDSPDDDEQKEDPLDLTVHCEPMFVELEEEKETDDNRSYPKCDHKNHQPSLLLCLRQKDPNITSAIALVNNSDII
ncbi:hypothetical protein J6590_042571 [Homalodisca vitripennis]|nr:hypothetical protein J6590_042571 [Homalodisca vitripennis]